MSLRCGATEQAYEPMTKREQPPPCPRHPGSTVWRDGTYGTAGRRRRRYLCIPGAGEPRHTFTESRGAPPRGFSYSAREIATALTAVGKGQSYRAAGKQVLEAGGRVADGNTVADWVEVFAPAIFERTASAEWPDVLALDSLPLRARMLDETGEPLGEDVPALQIFAGLALRQRGRFELVALEAFPGAPAAASRPHWDQFLRSRPGVPSHVVCDPDIVEAAEAVWPRPRTAVVACHAHLQRELVRLLHREEDKRLARAATHAFDGPAQWRAFVEHPRRRRLRTLESWLDLHGDRIARALAAPLDAPTSVRPLERHLEVLQAVLAPRRGNLRNRERTNRLLMLLQLELSGRADDERYARIIQEDVLARGGSARPRRVVAETRSASP
jgi:hypothetical protein